MIQVMKSSLKKIEMEEELTPKCCLKMRIALSGDDITIAFRQSFRLFIWALKAARYSGNHTLRIFFCPFCGKEIRKGENR
jgi:hypothetical protein